MTNITPDITEIRRTLGVLFKPGQVVEVRALDVTTPQYKNPHTVSGYFDDFETCAQEAERVAPFAKGVYVVLNSCNPALLARSFNRLKPLSKSDPTTGDTDITGRRWMLIDCDPVRPAGISASDEEKDHACEIAQAIRENLRSLDWPEPIFADSGNGYHLLYPVDLPAGDGELIKKSLQALADFWNDEQVKIDQSVFNPARISKLYGTAARKGDNMPGRPHRLAHIIDIPEHLEAVPDDLLQDLANDAPKSKEPQQTSAARAKQSFDIDRWIADHNLDVGDPQKYKGGRKWIFNKCPFNQDHVDKSAFLVQFPNGALSAGCHHNSCTGRGWPELREIYEPGYRNTPQTNDNPEEPPDYPELPPGFQDGIKPGSDVQGTPANAGAESLPPAAPKYERLTAADALQPYVEGPHLVENLITPGTLSVWYGEGGSGKTYSLLTLAACVAAGLPWLGKATKQTNVLIIDQESGKKRMQKRLGKILRGLELGPDTPITYYCFPGFKMDDPHGTSQVLLKTMIDAERAGFVVMDALAEIMDGDENSKQETQPVFNSLRWLADQTNAAVCLIHHSNKSGGFRGSTVVKNGSDLLVNVVMDESVIKFETEKNRDGEDSKWSAVATWIGEDDGTFTMRAIGTSNKSKPLSNTQKMVLDLFETAGKPTTAKEIKDQIDMDVYTPAAIRKAIEDLLHFKRISRTNKGKRGIAAIYKVCDADSNIDPMEDLLDE
jgi:hypothetical protein